MRFCDSLLFADDAAHLDFLRTCLNNNRARHPATARDEELIADILADIAEIEARGAASADRSETAASLQSPQIAAIEALWNRAMERANARVGEGG
jgi:hypothetical protein